MIPCNEDTSDCSLDFLPQLLNHAQHPFPITAAFIPQAVALFADPTSVTRT